MPAFAEKPRSKIQVSHHLKFISYLYLMTGGGGDVAETNG
jgi:hypothetical protein